MKENLLYAPMRSGILDTTNSFMFRNAEYDKEDIPFLKSNNVIPKKIISYKEAKLLHNVHIKNSDLDYHEDAFIHFYVDDQYFDSLTSGIWAKPMEAYKIIKHFSGIITPDFSIYQDYPKSQKQFNIYRMHGFGLFIQSKGINVINNIRWGTKETWSYCFSGYYKNDLFAIGTVASNLQDPFYLKVFNDGFIEMSHLYTPPTLIIVGSSKYEVIQNAQKRGVQIIQFNGETADYYERRRKNE